MQDCGSIFPVWHEYLWVTQLDIPPICSEVCQVFPHLFAIYLPTSSRIRTGCGLFFFTSDAARTTEPHIRPVSRGATAHNDTWRKTRHNTHTDIHDKDDNKALVLTEASVKTLYTIILTFSESNHMTSRYIKREREPFELTDLLATSADNMLTLTDD